MKTNKGFEKFINKQSGAKKKEAYRQEKRKAKQEMRAYGEELRKEKLAKEIGAYQKTEYRKNRKNSQDFDNLKNDKRSIRERKEAFASQYNDKKIWRNQNKKQEIVQVPEKELEQMPLNKFIAHAGICSRREAAEMVKKGLVIVNADIVYEPGYKVLPSDTVKVKGEKIAIQQKMVYVLMNKPKDHITTLNDEKGRKTVLDLVKNHISERIYPVGRLDRNTTGVLLLTNDGDLAQRLTHPSFLVKKIYEVTLDKSLKKEDAEKILAGLTLEDGFIKADDLGYVDTRDKKIIGIEIHSGKKHIVKRIFYHLGYSVTKLDRVMFANLTKKNVERGKWRLLTEKEIISLKSLNNSKKRRKIAIDTF